MKYRKETTDYGMTILSAVQPDYDQELQIIISANHLVCRISFHPSPLHDVRVEISKDEYMKQLGAARVVFNEFLKM